jgi:hypothetical protein
VFQENWEPIFQDFLTPALIIVYAILTIFVAQVINLVLSGEVSPIDISPNEKNYFFFCIDIRKFNSITIILRYFTCTFFSFFFNGYFFNNVIQIIAAVSVLTFVTIFRSWCNEI